jgi:hypothetical protein
MFVLKNSSTDENIKKTAIVEDNAKQEDKEKQNRINSNINSKN